MIFFQKIKEAKAAQEAKDATLAKLQERLFAPRDVGIQWFDGTYEDLAQVESMTRNGFEMEFTLVCGSQYIVPLSQVRYIKVYPLPGSLSL